MHELEKGFISKEIILSYLTQEEIFSCVFGYEPVENTYVTSPFRSDIKPNCWFEYDHKNRLRFKDFANSSVVNGVSMMSIDCFDAVKVYYKIPNFYQTMVFIKNNLIIKHNKKPIVKNKIINSNITKDKTKIFIQRRPFVKLDANFWSRYGISSSNLIEDKVFAISRYKIHNNKTLGYSKIARKITYAYCEFNDNKKKIYAPFSKPKFITNCTGSDIGGIKNLKLNGEHLIISKSYKDYRVLKNFNYDTIWFQNEGMLPSDALMYSLFDRFKKVTVFFDNDKAGILAAKKVFEKYNNCNINYYHLPVKLIERNVTDPSDMYYKIGKNHLIKLLKENL